MTTTLEGMTDWLYNHKIDKRYVVEAILMQLKKWQDEGEQAIYFGALAIHPEASDDCTFGDLIEVATKA